jgi:hypothetical protein
LFLTSSTSNTCISIANLLLGILALEKKIMFGSTILIQLLLSNGLIINKKFQVIICCRLWFDIFPLFSTSTFCMAHSYIIPTFDTIFFCHVKKIAFITFKFKVLCFQTYNDNMIDGIAYLACRITHNAKTCHLQLQN